MYCKKSSRLAELSIGVRVQYYESDVQGFETQRKRQTCCRFMALDTSPVLLSITFDMSESTCFKDARSVALYPYNRSQILQYVKYTK